MFFDGGRVKALPSGALVRFRLHLVHVEGWIGHDVVALALLIVGVEIEDVALASGIDDTSTAVHRQIHQAQLGIVLHLPMAEKSHGIVGQQSGLLYNVADLDEHSAAAAGGFSKKPLGVSNTLTITFTRDSGVQNTPSSWKMFLENLLRKYP